MRQPERSEREEGQRIERDTKSNEVLRWISEMGFSFCYGYGLFLSSSCSVFNSGLTEWYGVARLVKWLYVHLLWV